MGRHTKYKDADELENMINQYFEECARDHEPTTITGLVLFCGYANRVSFYELEDKPEFTNAIKKARTRIEKGYERNLHRPGCTGSIFALKNFGWRDDKQIDVTSKGEKINNEIDYSKLSEQVKQELYNASNKSGN